jgi:Aspartyl protease
MSEQRRQQAMKKYLLAAVAALAIGGVAHASDVACHLTDQRGNTLDYTFHWATGDPAIQELGFTRNGQNANYNHTPLWHGFNNPDSSTITSDEAPGWFITYATTPGNGQAALWHNRNMVAQGECYTVPTVAAAPAYNPASAPYNPPTPVASAGEDSVGLINVGKAVMVQVTLGSQPVTMIVDTGATGMLVPAKVADKLVASGEASNADDAKIQQADGNTVTERTILIHSLTSADIRSARSAPRSPPMDPTQWDCSRSRSSIAPVVSRSTRLPTS